MVRGGGPAAPLGCAALVVLSAFACAGPHGGDPDLAYHRGLTALSEGRSEKAAEYFAADLQAHPDHAEAMRYMAAALLQGANPHLAKAAELLERYLAVDPDDAESQRMLVDTLFRNGDWDAARARLEFLDDSLMSQRWRVNVLMQLDPEAALAVAESTLAEHPDDPLLLELAAEIELRRKNPERAWELGQRAVAAGSTRTELFYLLVRVARMAGWSDRVAEQARIHENLDRLQPAPDEEPLTADERLEVLAELAEQLPAASSWLRFMRATTLLQGGRPEEVIGELETLRADPELSDQQRLELAAWAELAGLVEWASMLYADVLANDPGSRAAINGLATIAYTEGRFDELERLARSGLEREPHLGRYHELLGLAFVRTERYREAEQSLARALELAPWEAEWRLRLADVLMATGRRDDSARVLARAPVRTPQIEEYCQRHGLTKPSTGTQKKRNFRRSR